MIQNMKNWREQTAATKRDTEYTVAWKGHTLQFTAVTSTKQPSRLQFTPSRLQNTRHVYKSAVKSTIRNRHAYKTSCES